MPLVVVLGVGSLLSAILTAYASARRQLRYVPADSAESGFHLADGCCLDYTPSSQWDRDIAVLYSGFVRASSSSGSCFAGLPRFTTKPRLSATQLLRFEARSDVKGLGLLLTCHIGSSGVGLSCGGLGLWMGWEPSLCCRMRFALIYPLTILACQAHRLGHRPALHPLYADQGISLSARYILFVHLCAGYCASRCSVGAGMIYGHAQEVIEVRPRRRRSSTRPWRVRPASLLKLAIWGLPAEAVSRVLLVPLLQRRPKACGVRHLFQSDTSCRWA
jgi:hypothetical protein